MHTESQKEAAIYPYIKYGLRNVPVLRKLGYPYRSVLSDWILEDVKNHQTSILKGESSALNN